MLDLERPLSERSGINWGKYARKRWKNLKEKVMEIDRLVNSKVSGYTMESPQAAGYEFAGYSEALRGFVLLDHKLGTVELWRESWTGAYALSVEHECREIQIEFVRDLH